MFDKARSRRRQRPASDSREKFPLLDVSPAAQVIASVAHSLKPLGQKVGPWISKAGDKVGDAYSSVAQVLSVQKEAIQDHWASRRSRAQKKRGSAAD